MTNTLVVNLFAGPGTGKSTNAALTFGKLKVAGVNAEIASEYAKDLVWEGRKKALNFQPYVIAKQMYKVHRLLGQVDVVITDSPILFGLIYGAEMDGYWREHVAHVFESWRTLNFHLVRNLEHHPYNEKGRTQTVEQAQGLDKDIKILLDEFEVCHTMLRIGPGETTADIIKEYILRELDHV